MRLIHFSADPVVSVWSSPQNTQAAPKPKGLWVSDEASEEDGRLAVAHEVVLAESANILRVDDVDGIDELTRQHVVGEYARDGYRLNWSAVAEQYQGILITPYQWTRRLSMHCGWYYGWDCASGCIWDASAVASIAVVELAPLVGEP